MSGMLSLDQLKEAVTENRIDTVIAAIIDMQGRLMGKRFHAQHFIDSAWEETHCCDYLLATDIEMGTPEGYESSSWSSGYGDYIMKPDLSTLRMTPWAQNTAMVLCDVLDHHTHEEVEHADYQKLTPISPYNEDYHIFQTAKEEALMRDIRNQLYGAGIPVENTKGEAEAGQAELNIKYADSLAMADNHSIAKNAVKEIAYKHGKSVTFLSKCSADTVGSSAHVHHSLDDQSGKPVFFDESRQHGMSSTMEHYLAGQLKYAAQLTPFFAPYINSYKRFARGTFAPTKIVWSIDNRTAAYRIVGENTPGVRFECRVGGSDLNPYLVMSGIIAAGIAGIQEKLALPECYSGDAYAANDQSEIPKNLGDASREALGDNVVDHYVHAANWEITDYARVVTDYEIKRGFERA